MDRRAELELLTQEELDELVSDYKDAEAAFINNGGKEEQVAYILEAEMEN